MKTRLLLSSLIIALSATSFSQPHKAHWSYNGKESPEHWGDLLTEYQTCKLGKVQSPVNLEADNGMKVANKPLKMNYFPAAYQVENNGHTVQVSVAQENAPFITLNNKPFYLKQFHFHTPSEHTFKRQHYPLEIHFVHQSEDKALATTPPCSENVAWTIFKSPIQASKAQIAAIEEMEGKNNRPTQPLNQRDVEVEQ